MKFKVPSLLSPRSLMSLFLGMGLLLSAQSRVQAEGVSGFLLVSNKGDQTMSIVDPNTLTQIATVPEEGVTGHELTASGDGKLAFVPIFGNSGVGKPGTDGTLIRVIDIAARKIIHTIDYGKGVRPHCPIRCDKTGNLYVTTELENSISIIDPKTFKITGSITTGQEQSHMLIVSNDGKRGYTANVGPGTVSILDLVEKKLLTVLPVATHVQRIAISNDDKWVFTSDQVQPRVAVISTETNKVEKWIDLPDYGYGAAPTPDGKFLIIAMPNSMQVGEIDLATMKLVRTVKVVKSPQEVLIRPDGVTAYVSCDADAKVAAINLKDFTVEKLIEVGKTADGLAWARGN
jgi:DNA-binding beta-propeller fold protein YncE